MFPVGSVPFNYVTPPQNAVDVDTLATLTQFLQSSSNIEEKALNLLQNPLPWEKKLEAILKATACTANEAPSTIENFFPAVHLQYPLPPTANLQNILAKVEEMAWKCSDYYSADEKNPSLPIFAYEYINHALEFLSNTREEMVILNRPGFRGG